MTAIFSIQRPKPGTVRLPIVVSAPHVGVAFPDDLRSQIRPDIIARPTDTDWLIHELYNFVPELGITLIHANYSRYVIDLNRDPNAQKLYADGRVETGLIPLYTFNGEPLYSDSYFRISDDVRQQRLNSYYWPYWRAVEDLLGELRTEHSQVLLYDAHSIARLVPNIARDPFPDLILGTNDGRTAAPEILHIAGVAMRRAGYQVSENHPFKGGYITRSFGKPEQGIHALQMERSYDIYMNESLTDLDQLKAQRLRIALADMFLQLAAALKRSG